MEPRRDITSHARVSNSSGRPGWAAIKPRVGSLSQSRKSGHTEALTWDQGCLAEIDAEQLVEPLAPSARKVMPLHVDHLRA